jgi:hypothetical protein
MKWWILMARENHKSLWSKYARGFFFKSCSGFLGFSTPRFWIKNKTMHQKGCACNDIWCDLTPISLMRQKQGATNRCRLSWLTNSALVYEPKCGKGGGCCGVLTNKYEICTNCTWCPNKLWRSNSNIFKLWAESLDVLTVRLMCWEKCVRGGGREQRLEQRLFSLYFYWCWH